MFKWKYEIENHFSDDDDEIKFIEVKEIQSQCPNKKENVFQLHNQHLFLVNYFST